MASLNEPTGDSGPFRILIVGLGPAGLALALALLWHPHSTRPLHLTLVDAHPSPILPSSPPVGAGFALSPNGLRALSQLSPKLVQDVLARAQRVSSISQHDARAGGFTIAQNDVPPKSFGFCTAALERQELVRALLDALAEKGGEVHVGWGTKFAGAREVDGKKIRVVLKSAEGTEEGKEEEVEVDLLVGADGVRSRVREFVLGGGPGAVGSDCPPLFSGYECIYGVSGPIDGLGDEHTGSAHWIVDPSGVGGYGTWDLPDCKQFWYTISASPHPRGTTSAPRFDGASLDETLERCKTLWHPFPGGFKALVDATDPARITKAPLLARVYEKLSNENGTAVLIGDAAHPVTPFLGQGANTSLEDAIVLANALFPPPPSPPRGLEWYTAQRVPRLQSISKCTSARLRCGGSRAGPRQS